MSDETKAIVPLQERDVDFYGDRIVAALVRVEGREEPQLYVPLRPVCEYMGLSWSAQFERIQRDPVLADEATPVRVTRMEDQSREMVVPAIEFLHGWLFGISVNRVKGEIREKVIRYQREC